MAYKLTSEVKELNKLPGLSKELQSIQESQYRPTRTANSLLSSDHRLTQTGHRFSQQEVKKRIQAKLRNRKEIASLKCVNNLEVIDKQECSMPGNTCKHQFTTAVQELEREVVWMWENNHRISAILKKTKVHPFYLRDELLKQSRYIQSKLSEGERKQVLEDIVCSRLQKTIMRVELERSCKSKQNRMKGMIDDRLRILSNTLRS